MAVNPSSSKGKGSKGGARKPQGVCWNCGEAGYYKDKCPKPKVNKAKDDSTRKKKVGSSTNAATKCKSNSESNGAWVAIDLEDKMMIGYEDSVSSSDND